MIIRHRSVGDIVLMSEVCHGNTPAKYRPSTYGIIVGISRHIRWPTYAVLDMTRDMKLPWYCVSEDIKTVVNNVPSGIQEELEARLIKYVRSNLDPWFSHHIEGFY